MCDVVRSWMDCSRQSQSEATWKILPFELPRAWKEALASES